MSGWFFPEGGRFAFRREPLVQGGEAFAQEAAEGEAAGPIHGSVFEPDDGRGAEEQELVEGAAEGACESGFGAPDFFERAELEDEVVVFVVENLFADCLEQDGWGGVAEGLVIGGGDDFGRDQEADFQIDAAALPEAAKELVGPLAGDFGDVFKVHEASQRGGVALLFLDK